MWHEFAWCLKNCHVDYIQLSYQKIVQSLGKYVSFLLWKFCLQMEGTQIFGLFFSYGVVDNPTKRPFGNIINQKAPRYYVLLRRKTIPQIKVSPIHLNRVVGHVRTPRSHQSFHKYVYAFIPFTVNNRKRKIINWYWVANTNNFSLADPTRRLPAFQSSTERAWNRLGLYRSFCMYAYADLYYLKHLAVVTGEVEEIGNSQWKSYNFIFFFLPTSGKVYVMHNTTDWTQFSIKQ